MKIIIQGNNKDYYKYLVSIYEMDGKVVFDRKTSHIQIK